MTTLPSASSFRRILALLYSWRAVPSCRFYTDWLWFGELGYQQVYTTIAASQATLFTIAFVVAVLWLVGESAACGSVAGDGASDVHDARRLDVSLPGRRQFARSLSAVAMRRRPVRRLYARQWETWLTWRNAVPFGQPDPILGHDVAFYVFTLPFLQLVRGIARAGRHGRACRRRHLFHLRDSSPRRLFTADDDAGGAPPSRGRCSLPSSFCLAAGAWLGQPRSALHPAGVISAPSIPTSRPHPGRGGSAALSLLGGRPRMLQGVHAPQLADSGRRRPLSGRLYRRRSVQHAAAAVVVAPNEQVRENAVTFCTTSTPPARAFALDDVEERELSGERTLTRDDIERNAATLENVRLWDHQPLLDTFGQIQEIRTYYDFVSVDNDRYTINGAYPAGDAVGARAEFGSLPNRTWINERLTFTHGTA